MAEREERKVGGRILDWRELDRQPSEFGTWNEPNTLMRVAAHLLGFQGAHSVALRATADGRLEAALSALYNGSPVRLVATSGGLLRVQVEGSEVAALGSEGKPFKQGGDGRLYLDLAEIDGGPLLSQVQGVLPVLPLWACRSPDARLDQTLSGSDVQSWDLGSALTRLVVCTVAGTSSGSPTGVDIWDADSSGGYDRRVCALAGGNQFAWLNEGRYVTFYNQDTTHAASIAALAFDL